jgi:hypothetical protein
MDNNKRYLLLIFDLCDVTCKHGGWYVDIGDCFGGMAWVSMKIDKELKKFLNTKLYSYLTSMTHLDKILFFDAKEDMDKEIIQYQNKYSSDITISKMYRTHLFEEIYKQNKNKLTNKEFKTLILTAIEQDDLDISSCDIYYDDRML